jgi:hypothetical protein
MGLISLFAGWLETLYAVFFFLAGLNMIFTSKQPQSDLQHSAATHYEVYSRDNVINYILAATLILEAIIYFIIPVSKPLIIFSLWLFNVLAYPRFMTYFSQRLGKRLVNSYLREQLPELSPALIQNAVVQLNSQADIKAEALAADLEFSPELAARLIVLYNRYLQITDGDQSGEEN